MSYPDVNLPREVLTPENLIELREIAKRKDVSAFKERIDRYKGKFRESNPTLKKDELEKIALSYVGALCLIADRGYITLGIPYPPAPVGSVERQFLRHYEPERYEMFKQIRWQRDWT